jgi:predicted DNA-binding transcriptional regulator YafY
MQTLCGPPESIRLRLSRKAAQWMGMEESPLHASQQIEEKPDGTYEFTAEIAITPELEGSLLRWGLEVEVLEPRRLKDAILATARAIVERG